MNEITLIQPGGIKIPVKLESFTYGPRGFFVARNHDQGVHIALGSSSIASLVVELRRAADLLESKATRDEKQKIADEVAREVFSKTPPGNYTFAEDGLPETIEPPNSEITISDLRKPNPYSGQLSRADAEYNMRLLVTRFPWMFARDFDYKEATKLAEQILTEQAQQPDTQLNRDLTIVLPHLAEITRPDGSLNQSEVGRLIGCANSGSGPKSGRGRILAVVAELDRKRAA